ncbi:hypothetical protein [Flavobacterium chilense]|uniref:Uncharacterized protein n=1 Tax=Flavobacterium chilense TaxID=946677 RepID=A0A1M6XMJ4_9FLAO|nr:hypothetical protein [Flavobacterium chilense]SHL07126.1 hypothetical protein SAMN05444484_101197 [Flavobacterium chilense]
METTETTKALTPKEKRIAKLIADTEAKLKQDIADIENEEEAKEARKELEKKIKDEKANLEATHKEYIKDFEKEYGVKYKQDAIQTDSTDLKRLTVQEKCEIVEKEMIDGKPKYKLSDDGKSIIGAKGEPIRSIIKFDDEFKNKQTLGVTTYYKYLKPNVTKDELDKLFSRKDIVIDKLRDGTLTDEDKRLLKGN